GGAWSTSVNLVGSAGFAPVTSSAGLSVVITSGIVSMSSVQTVTATAATNPWSSAPGFNMPVVSVSSGLVQVSGTIVSASSGIVQLSSAPLVIVASSGGTQLVQSTAATNPW